MFLLAHGRSAGPKNMQRCRGLHNLIHVKRVQGKQSSIFMFGIQKNTFFLGTMGH